VKLNNYLYKMKHSKRLLLTSLLYASISLLFHYRLPNQTVDIQLHDTYLVLTKASIFFPFIFFFLLFAGIYFCLEKSSIKESRIDNYHFWGSILISFLIIVILLSKAWWTSQEMAPMGSPEFYNRLNIDNRFILCFLISLLLFILIQVVNFISILFSEFRKWHNYHHNRSLTEQ
jgi:heme/copper-type cytochrome/quinol oxidase subunit 1